MAPEAAGECQVRIQNLNTMIAAVSYVHLFVVWLDSNTSSRE